MGKPIRFLILLCCMAGFFCQCHKKSEDPSVEIPPKLYKGNLITSSSLYTLNTQTTIIPAGHNTPMSYIIGNPYDSIYPRMVVIFNSRPVSGIQQAVISFEYSSNVSDSWVSSQGSVSVAIVGSTITATFSSEVFTNYGNAPYQYVSGSVSGNYE